MTAVSSIDAHAVALLLLAAVADAPGQPLPTGDLFEVGIYGDRDRTVSCVRGPAGAAFEQVVWVAVPGEAGGAIYVTLRFDFASNVDLARQPEFHPQVTEVITTDYGDSVEWNMILEGCPSGWIEVVRQSFVLLDESPSRISIRGGDSWIRDCGFVLHRPQVVGSLGINQADCGSVPTPVATWSEVKATFR